MLSDRFNDIVTKVLLSRDAFQPHPNASARSGWDTLGPEIRDHHIRRGEEKLGFIWPAIPARMILGFLRHGDRKTPENTRSTRRSALADLVLAECVENKGRFRVQVEDVPVNDARLAGVWGDCLYRIRFRATDPGLKDSWRLRITR
jgi:hypothetical protein